MAAVVPRGEKGSHLIAILPYSGQLDRAAALRFLRNLRGRERIQAVACDLSDELCTLIRTAWPGTIIVADLNHVIRDLLLRLVRARNAQPLSRRMTADNSSGRRRDTAKYLLEKRSFRLQPMEQKRRDLFLIILGDAVATIYWLKERFIDLFKISDKLEASNTLTDILSQIDSRSSALWYIEPFIKTVAVTWRDRILNYFDHRITTAYVERAIKMFKLRFALWSVSGDAEPHYVRTLIADGPLSEEEKQSLAWHTAESFRPEGRQRGYHDR